MSTEAKVMSTAERLEIILADIENPLRDSLRDQFYLLNALEVARVLHAETSLSDKTKGRILALRVGQPASYEGTDLAPLIDKAMQDMWVRLADDARGLHLG